MNSRRQMVYLPRFPEKCTFSPGTGPALLKQRDNSRFVYMPETKAQFITFEGPEGSGKTTQVRRLVKRLRGQGVPVLETREPGGTITGEMIREILQHGKTEESLCAETELLLFSASRAHLVNRVIRPALTSGTWVVCDRFFDSSTAYQAYGRGLDTTCVEKIHRFTVGATVPQRTYLLDIAIAESLRRMQRRNTDRETAPDRFERETTTFHERVYAGYLALARRDPQRIRIINAARPETIIADEIWEDLEDVIP